MLSTPSSRLLAVVIALASAPSTFVRANPSMTYQGCFAITSGFTYQQTQQFGTEGSCQTTCLANGNQAVIAITKGGDCYCSGAVPAGSTKVSDQSCNKGCNGYGQNACGNDAGTLYTVYLSGAEEQVPINGGGTATASATMTLALRGTATAVISSSPTTATSSAPSVIVSVIAGQTVTTTATADPSTQNNPAKSGGSNTGVIVGAVVGVVLGLLVLAGIIIFFVKMRRNRHAQEAYTNHQGSDFMGGMSQSNIAVPAPAMRGPRGPDSRFDAEAMAHNRLSDGSIADNEDYSRKILKVTNPDHRY